ncbi:MAG TPA: M56 family metallopeptidase [Jatrophihabitantaceae bacterium]|nr:M56 family metallopeptidase [Jatrophihabitantaceae bacterium]
MTPIVATPFLVSGLLWLTGARVGRRLPPAAAAVLLTTLALVTALATGLVLSLAGVLWLAQRPPVARVGHWSSIVLRSDTWLPGVAGALAGVCAFALLLAALRRTVRAVRAIVIAARTCRRLSPAAGGLVVIEDLEPTAYAVPGFSGRIVVSTAMLRTLSADERRALLAHEAAHLTYRHHVYTQLTDVAAAANPLLRPLRAAVGLAVERWADEAAAAETGDRLLVARALARAGVARSRAHSPQPSAALAAASTHLTVRIRALLDPPPRHRRLASGFVVALTACSIVAAGAAAQGTHDRFEAAQATYHHHG